MSQAEPDPNAASQKIVARVRALATGHPFAAICCDSGRSFRHDITRTYKANRPESDATLQHQITLAREQLAEDGFPIWAVRGFEADDLIASAVKLGLAREETTLLIVSADKDLLQLVGPRVRQMSTRDGAIFDAAAVKAKFGVVPEQICDYLCLMGDASDNVKGANGIGEKKAAALLDKYGSLDSTFMMLHEHGTDFKPAMATALKEFQPRLEETRSLITLRDTVEIPFDEMLVERVPVPQAFAADEGEDDAMSTRELPEKPTAEEVREDSATRPVDAAKGEVTDLPGNSAVVAPSPSRLNHEITVREADGPILPAPAEYERQLDPRSMRDAIVLAKDLHASRLFSAYGTPQGVLSTIMLGRELGLPAMGALRSVHIIEGKHTLAASAMVALVLRSGFAEYFEPVSFDEKQATYVTKRKGARGEVTLTHTIEMATQAGLVKPNSNWVKVPTDMLIARASARLARMVYPDILAGLYTPEEIAETRESAAA
jgi:5'-3' exonuclease